MMPYPAATGIVLAGGRSRRFGRDKLAEPVGDRPLLHLAIAALSAVTTEVVVVTTPGAEPDLPPGVRLVHDETPFEGPLAGCLAGLIAAREPLGLVVGGDMPSLRPAVLGLMLRTLAGSAADACVIEHLGRRQPLPMVLRTGTGTDLANRLLGEHERRLVALLDRLIVRPLAEGEWRALDPEALTLRDVDLPADLPGAEHEQGA